jgi:uncharacterized repeat protein (TIGR02543 family)
MQERPAYLIWKSSQVSGYDLREYWNQWGVRATDAAVVQAMNEHIEAGIAAQTIRPLSEAGVTVDDLLGITGTNSSTSAFAWAPLPLLGITASTTETALLDKSSWTIITSFAGAPVSATEIAGSDVPGAIIDNLASTAYCFVKPDKNLEGYTPSFTINMQTPQTFSGFVWANHSVYNGLFATSVSFYGSNDNSSWDLLVADASVSTRSTTVNLSAPVAYQYVKLVVTGWSSTGGSTIQVEEFDLIASTSLPTYTVKFELGDGLTPIPQQQVVEGHTATEPSRPARTGYTFIGWFTDPKYTTGWSFKTAVSQNVTLYVQWKKDAISAGPYDPLTVSPNPVTGTTIDVTNDEWTSSDCAYIEIYTIQGFLVKRVVPTGVTTSVDVSGISAGSYLVRMGNRQAEVTINN